MSSSCKGLFLENTLSAFQRWLWCLTILSILLAPSFREVDYKSYVVSIGFFLLLLLAALKLCKRAELSFSPLELYLALYVGWTCLSYLWSPVDLAASEYLGRFLPCVGIFWLVRQESTGPNASVRSTVWLASIFVIMIFGFLQAFRLDWIPAYFQPVDGRISSTFGNPNVYSAFLVLSFPILDLSQPKFKKPFLSLAILGIFVVFFLISLWLTQSRGGLVGLALELFILVFTTWPRIEKVKYGKWAITLFLITILGISFQNPSGFVFRPTERLEIWRGAVQMLMTKPLLGWGVGQFSLNFQPYMSGELAALALKSNSFAEHVHNEVLELGVELGLVGLLLATFFWGRLLGRAARQCLGSRKDAEVPPLWTLGPVTGLLGLGITNFFDYNCRLPGIAFFLWMAAGTLANQVFPTDKIKLKPPIGSLIAVLLVGGAIFGLTQETRLLAAVLRENPAKDFLKDIPADLTAEQQRILGNIKAQPGNPDNYHQLGNLFAKTRNFEGAQKAFEKEIELDHQSANGYLNLGNVFLLTSNNDPRRLELARACYGKYIALEPQKVEGHLDLAYVYFLRKDLKGALTELDTALKIEPQNPQALALKRQILP